MGLGLRGYSSNTDEDKLRKKGLKPFDVSGTVVWASSKKAAKKRYLKGSGKGDEVVGIFKERWMNFLRNKVDEYGRAWIEKNLEEGAKEFWGNTYPSEKEVLRIMGVDK